MASDTRKKTLFYKRAELTTSIPGETLQSLLEKALKAHKFPLRRKANPSGDERTFHFINYNLHHGLKGGPSNFLGVELFSYQKGADQSTLVVLESETEIDVRSILPPGTDQEFLEGALYFGVLDDHVIVMQSSALRTMDLERHLNWLLVTHSGLLDEGNGVSLIDFIPEKKGERFADAKKITLSAPVQFSAEAKPAERTAAPEDEAQSIKLRPKGSGWNALQAMVGELFDLPDYLNSDELLQSHALQVELQLKWKRTPDADTSDLLASIAHKLRHVNDELDYEIQTRNGKITKDDFKQNAGINIEWRDGRPRFDKLFPQMLSWLETLAKGGRVNL